MVTVTMPRDPIGTQRRLSILQRDDLTCLFCGSRPGTDRLTVDHFLPYSKGGSVHDNNLGSTCDQCHDGKRDRVIVPLSICTDEHDRQGWVIWKQWGQWVLSWNPGPALDEREAWPFIDSSCVIALTYEPEEYWIALDRVHEDDWHAHLEWKPWMRDDGDIAIIDAFLDKQAAERQARSGGRMFYSLSEWMAEEKHPLQRSPARGERFQNFCNAIDFARTLVRVSPTHN